jgi:hypothetical protein
LHATQVLGYPKSNSVNPKDDEMLSLLGEKHDSKLKAGEAGCSCNLCLFNDKTKNCRGEKYCIMVADAKECSEGVSFFGVRQARTLFCLHATADALSAFECRSS